MVNTGSSEPVPSTIAKDNAVKKKKKKKKTIFSPLLRW